MKSVTTSFTAFRRLVTRPSTSMSSVFMLPEMSMASIRSRPLLGRLTGSPVNCGRATAPSRQAHASHASSSARPSAAACTAARGDGRTEAADVGHAQRRVLLLARPQQVAHEQRQRQRRKRPRPQETDHRRACLVIARSTSRAAACRASAIAVRSPARIVAGPAPRRRRSRTRRSPTMASR